MEKRYDVWVEITANKEWILDAVKFEETMKKCRAVGMTGIILSVKDTTGFSLYPSQIAPHYSKYDKTFLPAYDYVKQCFSIIKNLGMKCYAAFDTFAAGNGKNPHPDMPGIKKDGFACEVYGWMQTENQSSESSQQRIICIQWEVLMILEKFF